MDSEVILKMAKAKGRITTRDIVKRYRVSRVYASVFLNRLVKAGKLIKFGVTRASFYAPPELTPMAEDHKSIKERLKNEDLKEHEIYNKLERQNPLLPSLKEDTKSIFFYAFTEMLNNAIEHSKSKYVEVAIESRDRNLIFHVDDFGIGVFRNVMHKRKLKSELEAIQDLLKGKTTTQPQSHSGEGIFFTSKIADRFILESFNYRLIIDNTLPDIFIEELPSRKAGAKRGTRVTFTIALNTPKHLTDIFRKFETSPTELAFDTTEIYVKLYAMGTIHISRSQARRILADLDKFKLIILDFDKVPTVGQAFADEIFRVFKERNPHVKIEAINMNDAVKFMIERVRSVG